MTLWIRYTHVTKLENEVQLAKLLLAKCKDDPRKAKLAGEILTDDQAKLAKFKEALEGQEQWEKDLRAEGISEYHLEVSMEIMRRASPDDPIMKYCLAPVPRPNLEAENLFSGFD